MIQSAASKALRKFGDLLKNAEKMTSYFANERSYDQNNCIRLALSSASGDNKLSSNQEKADTEILLHFLHALKK